MRTLSAPLLAAIAAPYSPDFRVELADTNPHFATVAAGAPTGPCASALAPDGSLINVYVTTSLPQTVKVQRVIDPANAGQYAVWTALTTDGRAQAGVCVIVSGATVRVLWQSTAGTAIWAADSTNNGVSFGAPASLFDPGHPCYGIAADQDLTRVFVAYDALGLGSVRVALWTLSGTWSHVDWTNGDLNQIVGLAAARESAGVYGLVLAAVTATGEAYSVQTFTYSAGWTGLSLVVPVDTSGGLSVAFPHLSFFDGAYRLTWRIHDDGTSSGQVYSRLVRSFSNDFQHWDAGVEDAATFPSGAAWIKHAAAYLLTAPETTRRAPLFDSSANYRDCSADLLRLDLVEKEGVPARAVITLDASTGVYDALSCLRPNASILLSQGVVGVGLVATHLLYVESWTFARTASTRQITILAMDRLSFMRRQARAAFGYVGFNVGWVTSDLACKAGLGLLNTTQDAAAQFTTVLAAVLVHAGERYDQALSRVQAVYDGSLRLELVAATGIAFGVIERLHFFTKVPGQASIWSYNGEPDSLRVTHSGDRANHIAAFGPSTLTAFGDSWDFSDVDAVGVERFALAVETQVFDGTTAALRSSLGLIREQRFALSVRAGLQPNPALELLDVVTFNDVSGNASTRITGLHLTYVAQTAVHECVLTGEGV